MSTQSYTCGCKVQIIENPPDQGNYTGVCQTYTEYCNAHRPRPSDQGAGDVILNIQIIPQW